jgi:hypothetical protein
MKRSKVIDERVVTGQCTFSQDCADKTENLECTWQKGCAYRE